MRSENGQSSWKQEYPILCQIVWSQNAWDSQIPSLLLWDYINLKKIKEFCLDKNTKLYLK